ncbi:asparagine synthase (glutamine-hydrolyzing) [Myxococcota bacterium]|nr:asparagine synthase (glutamine-hydrolyzing) [Myxococcota bacterium]
MCGISGVVVPPGQRVDRAVLARMNNTLRRRGPDDEGYYFDDDGGCGLGHRRLSIIDLTGGHQPQSAAGGQIQTVVNGEIYNFMEIRAELEKLGAVFKTNSDCEVVAHGYERWGEGIVPRLQGMFALAIWDVRTRKLLIARDRMGKKPFYYAFVGPRRDTLIFGSELKAIAAHPDLERRVSPTGLSAYLTYECLPEAETIFESVSRLLPGHYMVWDRDRARAEVREFWRMRFASSPFAAEVAGKSEDELVERLRGLIVAATKDRLISDVPLGVFLSGGIDSSVVTAAMAKSVDPRTIKTFSITFEDESFDEGPHARKVARHLGTDHHEERLAPSTMIDVLPEIAAFMCEPLGDASIIPTYLLSRFTRRTVTVALGGDGGDELFLGYPTFQADRVAARLDEVAPLDVQRALGLGVRRLASYLPVSRKNFSFDFKVKRFAQGLGYPRDQRHQAWMGSFMPDELAAVLSPELRPHALARDPYSIVAGFRGATDFRDRWDEAVYQYGRLYLTADVLVKVDRASMACGLEVRAPLLDTRIVELAAAIPGALKLKGMTTKYLLKRAARGWLPDEIMDRPKKGFGVPIGEWLRGPLRGMAHDLLSRDRVRREGYLDPETVARLLDEHERGVADHRKPLWTLLAFQLWLDHHGPASPRAGDEPRPAKAPRADAAHLSVGAGVQ